MTGRDASVETAHIIIAFMLNLLRGPACATLLAIGGFLTTIPHTRFTQPLFPQQRTRYALREREWSLARQNDHTDTEHHAYENGNDARNKHSGTKGIDSNDRTYSRQDNAYKLPGGAG
jgi:hypothetical protein